MQAETRAVVTASEVVVAANPNNGRTPAVSAESVSLANQSSRVFADMWPRLAIRTLSVVIAILLWKLAVGAHWHWLINFENVPGPIAVAKEFWSQLHNPTFYTHIGVSMKRIAFGYLLAAIIGIVIGVLMGCYKVAEDIVLPHIEILRPIPAVAWIPLAILMMPTEESSIIFITFLGALFPIIINTVHGVEHTPTVLLRAARSLGAGRGAIMRHVVLPAALPNIATGLAVGMGVSWFSLLAGEIISGQYGIGYFTWSAYTLVAYSKIIVGMLVIGGLGALSTALVRVVTKPFLRWQSDKGVKS